MLRNIESVTARNLLVFSAIGICLWLIRGNVVIELPTRLTEAFAAFNASLRRLLRRPVPA